jgi:signal transduction histidine kinase
VPTSDSAAGLAPALRSLADEAPLAVELHLGGDVSCPTPAETAAYVSVAESVGSADSRRATYVRVDVGRSDDSLVVEIRDDGEPSQGVPASLVDRVGALGGVLTASENLLRVEIPCA